MTSSPMGIWKAGFDAWRMLGEAQMVIALRMTGMAGFWRLSDGEMLRMVTEKQQAFGQSAVELTTAAMSGRPPEKVLAAALKPLGRKTKANARRLGRSFIRQL